MWHSNANSIRTDCHNNRRYGQANSLAADIQGRTPILSKVLKTATVVGGAVAATAVPFATAGERSLALRDQDAAVQEMARQHRRRRRGNHNKENAKSAGVESSPPLERPHFAYILTRPTTLLQEGPSTRTVSASKSVRACSLLFWRKDTLCFVDAYFIFWPFPALTKMYVSIHILDT